MRHHHPDRGDPAGGETHDHDRGLASDLSTMVERRGALKLLAGVGMLTLVGCATKSSSGSASSSTSTSSTTSTAAAASSTADATCTPIPEETAGPYPGDGSNGPDALAESGIVRSDIRSSFGSASGVADGVPTTVTLRISDTANGCAPLAGAAVYLWHCDRDGKYSMYSSGVADENYLRGVQETDDDGAVTFRSIFPAAYDGRWPHMHFEVYPDLAAATGGGTLLVTTQLALPEDACDEVFATTGYAQSVGNLARTSLDSDMVFRDGSALQVATVTGTVDDGLAVELAFAV
jgi:protocatechuate 3,4-dioxygenase beta subunit